MDETVLVVQTTLQIKVPDCVNKGREKNIYRRWNDERQPGCLIHTFYKRIRKNPCTRWAKKEFVSQKTLFEFPMIQTIKSILSFPLCSVCTKNLKSFHCSKIKKWKDNRRSLSSSGKIKNSLLFIIHKCCNQEILIYSNRNPFFPLENCNPNLERSNGTNDALPC